MSTTELPVDEEEIETYVLADKTCVKTTPADDEIETYVLAGEENKKMMIETYKEMPTDETSALTLMLAPSRSHQGPRRLPHEVWAMVARHTGEREFYEELFIQKCASLFQDLHTNPELLKTLCPEIKNHLHCQGNPKAQGSGNNVTDQEACFALELEKHGFKFLPKNAPNPMTLSLMYKYQISGSQLSGDFGLYAFYQGKIIREFIIDLKHTNSKTIMLNDGWFEENTIYVITWNAGTKKFPSVKTLIAFGQDIPSKEEQEYHDEIRTLRKQINAIKKSVGRYRSYLRGADSFLCDEFTYDITSKHLDSVLTAMALRSTPLHKTGKEVCAASHATSAPPPNSSDLRAAAAGLRASLNCFHASTQPDLPAHTTALSGLERALQSPAPPGARVCADLAALLDLIDRMT